MSGASGTGAATARDSGGPERSDRSGLLLVTGAGMVATFPLAGNELVIGRARECDVSLAHEALSRRHAVLRLGPPMTVQDLGSTNGTRVGDDVRRGGAPMPLGVGDGFHIGRLSFVVVRLPQPATSLGARVDELRVLDPASDEASPLVRDIAQSGVTVLVLGETGVGKEVLAETLHRASGRRGPLVRVNCAALSATLLESELFGHERGAFTGATRDKPGLFEAADGGTLFLDEVGELPPALQPKLLRVLESKEVLRVGAVKPLAVDVRVVAASNRDLPGDVAVGRFRADLFFRLDGVTLTVPPLRERRQAIAPLARRFLGEAHQRLRGAGTTAPSLAAEAIARLQAHAWPGNVRELKAVIERALLLARGGDVEARHVAAALGKPPSPRSASAAAATTAAAARPTATLPAAPALNAAEASERQRIVDALEACAGNQTRAARHLGISRATLAHKLALYRIPRPRK